MRPLRLPRIASNDTSFSPSRPRAFRRSKFKITPQALRNYSKLRELHSRTAHERDLLRRSPAVRAHVIARVNDHGVIGIPTGVIRPVRRDHTGNVGALIERRIAFFETRVSDWQRYRLCGHVLRREQPTEPRARQSS